MLISTHFKLFRFHFFFLLLFIFIYSKRKSFAFCLVVAAARVETVYCIYHFVCKQSKQKIGRCERCIHIGFNCMGIGHVHLFLKTNEETRKTTAAEKCPRKTKWNNIHSANKTVSMQVFGCLVRVCLCVCWCCRFT